MVIDTSAIAAILFNEPDAPKFEAAFAADAVRLMSTVTYVEAKIVVEHRLGGSGSQELETLLAKADVDLVSFSAEHAMEAVEAFRKYGKGRHPAALNFGDCIAYALAKSLGERLLFKGADFAQTD